jgi:hypothetical protein
MEKATGSMMSIVFNTNGKHLGYFAANLLVDETLKRGFAKAIETLAILFGGITGATIGLTVVGTYESLKNLCLLCGHLSKHPTLAKSADPRFLECLNDLPAEIFSEEDKQQIKNVTKGLEPNRFFVEQNAKKKLDKLIIEEIILDDDNNNYIGF